jgi:ABC-type nitrate/sulfonate/bicarbonate transport system permease component
VGTIPGPHGLAAPPPPAGWLVGRRFALGRLVTSIAGLGLILALWQLSVPLIGLSDYFYPSPATVARALGELITKGILPVYVRDSLLRYLGSVVVGGVLGLLLGVAVGLHRGLARLLAPFVNFLYAIVEGAWIPLFVVWWGYGIKVIVVLLVYIIFFPMFYNTLVGVRTVPQVYVNAARALGARPWQVVREVILPAALPNIITGFRVGAGFAFRGLIFAEMLAAKTGVGYLIYEGVSMQNTPRTIVGMICMGVLWLFIDRVYLKPFERATIERWGVVVVPEGRR